MSEHASRERRRLVCVVVPILVWIACGPAREEAPDGDDQVAAVRAVTAAIIRADNAGDLEAVIELYTEDAILLPPGNAPIRGRPAIRQHYARLFRQNDLDVSIESEETRVAGEWAFDRGRTRGQAQPKDGGPVVLIDDTYVMLLRRDAGRGWRIARLIWNASGGAEEGG